MKSILFEVEDWSAKKHGKGNNCYDLLIDGKRWIENIEYSQLFPKMKEAMDRRFQK